MNRSPSLKKEELHVWAIPLSLTSEQSETALAWLNPHQMDRYQRRSTARQKETYLAGRYFLLQLLGQYSDLRPEEISLSYTRLNKPYLEANSNNIAFNFTDSSLSEIGVGLYAFYNGSAIGVDIESLSRQGNFAAIARRKFSAREQALCKDHNGDINEQQFLALWTRKEAYGKATGLGINFKMRDLDLASPEQHRLSFAGLRHSTAYQLHQFMVGTGHLGCMVYAADKALSLQAFSPDPALVADE